MFLKNCIFEFFYFWFQKNFKQKENFELYLINYNFHSFFNNSFSNCIYDLFIFDLSNMSVNRLTKISRLYAALITEGIVDGNALKIAIQIVGIGMGTVGFGFLGILWFNSAKFSLVGALVGLLIANSFHGVISVLLSPMRQKIINQILADLSRGDSIQLEELLESHPTMVQHFVHAHKKEMIHSIQRVYQRNDC